MDLVIDIWRESGEPLPWFWSIWNDACCDPDGEPLMSGLASTKAEAAREAREAKAEILKVRR